MLHEKGAAFKTHTDPLEISSLYKVGRRAADDRYKSMEWHVITPFLMAENKWVSLGWNFTPDNGVINYSIYNDRNGPPYKNLLEFLYGGKNFISRAAKSRPISGTSPVSNTISAKVSGT